MSVTAGISFPVKCIGTAMPGSGIQSISHSCVALDGGALPLARVSFLLALASHGGHSIVSYCFRIPKFDIRASCSVSCTRLHQGIAVLRR